MNEEQIYLVHKEDYLRHVQEKLVLYHYARQLSALIDLLPDEGDFIFLKSAAAGVSCRCNELFHSWGLSGEKLRGNLEDILEDLAQDELITPEEGGFLAADDCCGCENRELLSQAARVGRELAALLELYRCEA